ncbi:MAG TPA: trypsin-like peptidase domain-containing protein [Vicinamibacteria bacterium]
MDEPLRQPCPECAEPVALDARLCPHCFSTALVDVVLRQPVADARVRHTAARALQTLGGEAAAYSAIQAAMASPQPAALRGVARSVGQAALATLAEHGIAASLERTAAPRAPRDLGPWLKAGVAGLAAAAALGTGWALLGARQPAGPAAVSATGRALPVSATVSDGPALSSRALARRSLPSTVSLRCPNSVGSGFFVGPDLVLTNNHVLCAGGGSMEVVLADGRRLPGTVVRAEARVDLGLVQVSGAGVEPLPLGDVADLAVGDRVMMIGSPVGLEFTVHEGNVSSLSRSVEGVAYVQLDAKVNPGNSGGPLIDERGRVVGVVTLKHSGAEGIGLALPINYAYSEPWRLLPTPGGPAARPAVREMMARAQQGEGSGSRIESSVPAGPGNPLLDGRPLLVGATVDQYRRLVVRVLRVSVGPPAFEEVAIKVWSDSDNFCTLKGDVGDWKPVEPQQAGTGVDARVLTLVQQRAEGRYLYVGESPLRWDLCDGSRMRPGIELELDGASPLASRIQLR